MEKYYTIDPAVDELIEEWERCSEANRRFSFYGYLELVYRLYVDLLKKEQERWAIKKLTECMRDQPLYENDLVRMLIDASCDADRKTKSRWARALRYICSLNVHWQHCSRFLKANGGPAGCAKKQTQRVPERRRADHYRGPDKKYLKANELRRLTARFQLLNR